MVPMGVAQKYTLQRHGLQWAIAHIKGQAHLWHQHKGGQRGDGKRRECVLPQRQSDRPAGIVVGRCHDRMERVNFAEYISETSIMDASENCANGLCTLAGPTGLGERHALEVCHFLKLAGSGREVLRVGAWL